MRSNARRDLPAPDGPRISTARLSTSTAEAIVGLVVDLSAPDAERLPPPEALLTQISGIKLPRIPVGVDYAALPLVVAALTMTASSSSTQPSADCSKGIGNHIGPSIATE